MWDRRRRLLVVFLSLGVLAATSRASAWVETRIVSSVVTLDVARDGKAEVGHELRLRVQGGPLTSYEIGGVDADAEPLPGAMVTREGGGRDTSIALLQHRADDGSLLLEIDSPRGLRHGRYMLRFGYRTDLRKSGYLQTEGSRAMLRWVSPRFANGVDSMKVLWRVPPGGEPPTIPGAMGEATGLSIDEGSAGVFLASVRRSVQRDEVELVRPHVATGEPVVWRIRTAADVFGHAPSVRSIESRHAPTPLSDVQDQGHSGKAFCLAVLAGSLYALLVWAKRLLLERQARGLGLQVAPGRWWSWRSVAAGVGLGLAVLVLWRSPHLVGAAAIATGAMGLAWQTHPRVTVTARGPGRWLPLQPAEAFRDPRSAARLLDITTLPGALTFAGAEGVLFASCQLWAPGSLEVLWTVLILSAALVPLFFTGVGSIGPTALALRRGQWLRWLYRRLLREEGIRVSPCARVPHATSEPDELRLRVVPVSARAGLVAIEVALHAPLGIVEPCVLVRVRDGSECYRALSPVVAWMRGRKPAERVAVVHPRLPTRGMLLALTKYLAALLDAREEGRPFLDLGHEQERGGHRAGRNRARSSSGSAASTQNPGTSTVPFHAM